MSSTAILDSLMLAFDGHELPGPMRARLAARGAAGVSLFRYLNVGSPAEVRALTDAIGSLGTFRVAGDQEGGQLMGLGDGTTPFAGNMALGAAGDAGLAQRVGAAIGTELRAMGVTVDYAPVCDLATNPDSPSVGVRSFGDDPVVVSALAAAMVRGIQSAGVAATLKHYPGSGDVAVDPHHALGSVPHDRERLESLELAPFRAGIDAGARLVMSGHFAVPALDGGGELPATLSRAVLTDLLRGEMGFDGLIVSDALDMGALPQGAAQAVDVIAALRAGVDLLLCPPDPEAIERIEGAVLHAAARRLLDTASMAGSRRRLADLRRWLAGFEQPPLEVVGSTAHRALAGELSARSLTLVRDEAGLLPLRLGDEQRVLAIMPAPQDLTPADTSASVTPGLAAALRRHHGCVDELIVSQAPTPGELAALRERAAGYDLLVIGTISASLRPEQATLVQALAERLAVTVALRTPFDLAAYPQAATHACTYSILQPSLDALADALFGRAGFPGRLPAAIPGLYPTGHGLGR